MKYIKYIVLSGLVGIFLWSCKEDELNPVVHLNNAPSLTSPGSGTSWELKEANANDLLPAFTWTAADFGFDAGTSYKLELDKAGNNFAEAVTLGVVNALSFSITQGDLNNILLAKELEGESPADVEIRVTASINADVAALVSNVVTLTVTPYSATVVIPTLHVPGSYQGWNPGDETTVIFSPKSDNKFEGYLFIGPDNSEFKYTLGPSWDVNWGDTGADGTLDPGGDNIKATTAGVYRLNVDLNTLTHTYALTNWGLIGSATADGWNSDQDLTYDAGANKLTITTDLVVGEIKFRANDAWDINFGDDGNNKTLEYGAANIPIAEAGNYTIDLLIIGVAKYKYAIKKN